MSSNKRKTLRILLIALLCGTVLMGSFALYLFKTEALSIDGPVSMRLEASDNLETLTERLQKEHGLKHPAIFKLLAQRMNLESNMKKGRYHLEPEMTLRDLVKIFREGKLKTVDLVIRPQSDLDYFIQKCADKLEPDDSTFRNILNNNPYLETLGFDTSTVYALILPDKYNVYWHTDAIELMERLKKEYDKFWNGQRLQLLQRTGLSQIEVSVLASIVAKETSKTDEMPMIAGMYLNRLRTEMPLQADPTVKFALKQPGLRRILEGHLKVVSPYNTYLNKGLPPGPICIPGKEVIDAVLHFSEHNYLFMCAKDDFSGYHAFASNYDDHLKNARRYRQALDARNIH